MWKSLGFSNSPYNTQPLSPCEEDAALLVGRQNEMITLCTEMESNAQGVYVISGQPGVGKTSFFNVTQYLLENSLAPCGPHLLAARALCPIRPGDDDHTIAQRAVTMLVRSIEAYCTLANRPLPPETKKISKWIGARGGGSVDFGINILNFGANFGRSVDLPPYSEATFERLQDVLTCLISEVVAVLGFDGAFIAIDNLENLEDRHIGDLLLSFRDTLFQTPNVWWVLIGPSGLGSMIQTLEPKVFERLSGVGLELPTIELKELHEAIEKRVQRFHASGDGHAPLPMQVHDHLFKASHGEIRFVFKYGNAICTQFLSGVRTKVLSDGLSLNANVVDKALGRILVQQQIPERVAESVLTLIVKTELEGLNLKRKDKEILAMIGEVGGTRPSNFRDFGLKSIADFSTNYLRKLLDQNLLLKIQQGRNVIYKLRGLASLAAEYKLLRL